MGWDAVYENGILRPLEPLPFTESQRVRIIVSDVSQDTGIDQESIEAAQAHSCDRGDSSLYCEGSWKYVGRCDSGARRVLVVEFLCGYKCTGEVLSPGAWVLDSS